MNLAQDKVGKRFLRSTVVASGA